MTQSQIADEIGVSQMHVSRLLNRTLGAACAPPGGGVLLVPGLTDVPRARRCCEGTQRPTSTSTATSASTAAATVVQHRREAHATPSG